MESRKSDRQKPNLLPPDFLKMVCEVSTTAFAEFLKEAEAQGQSLHFECNGAIFKEELILSLSLCQKDRLGATTVSISSDFDPKASAPKAEDLLALCVDAAGEVLQTIVEHPKNRESLLDASLSAFEDIPFEWTPMEIQKRRLYVKVDRSNPKLDLLADDWLQEHDPLLQAEAQKEEEETKSLFITGKPPTDTRH